MMNIIPDDLKAEQSALTAMFQQVVVRGGCLGDADATVSYLAQQQDPRTKAEAALWFVKNGQTGRRDTEAAATVLAATTRELATSDPVAAVHLAIWALENDRSQPRQETAWDSLDLALRDLSPETGPSCDLKVAAICTLFDHAKALSNPEKKADVARAHVIYLSGAMLGGNLQVVAMTAGVHQFLYDIAEARGDQKTMAMVADCARQIYLENPESAPAVAAGLALWLDQKGLLCDREQIQSEPVAKNLIQAIVAGKLSPETKGQLGLVAFRFAPEDSQLQGRARNLAGQVLQQVESPAFLIQLYERHGDCPGAQGIVEAALKANAENGPARVQIATLQALAGPETPIQLVRRVVHLGPDQLTARMNRLFATRAKEQRQPAVGGRAPGSRCE